MNVAILTPIRLFGEALASFLNILQTVSEVTIARNFSSLLDAMHSRSRIDLVLIDVAQGIDLEEVRAFSNQWTPIALVAIGFQVNHKEIIRFGRAGFSGYLPRDTPLTQLYQTMEDSLAGRLNCTPEISGELFRALYREKFVTDAEEYGEALTPRECVVLREISSGHSNKEIARRLGLSISTIKHHVHKILGKLHVSRRAEAMRKVRNDPWIAGSIPAGGSEH